MVIAFRQTIVSDEPRHGLDGGRWIGEIEALRGFAALLVFAYHLNAFVHGGPERIRPPGGRVSILTA